MRATVILNPASGRGRGKKMLPTLERILRASGLNFDLLQSKRPWHAAELAEYFSAEREELLGRSMDEIVPPNLRHRKVELLERLEREQSCLIELPLLQSDGDFVWVELNAS